MKRNVPGAKPAAALPPREPRAGSRPRSSPPRRVRRVRGALILGLVLIAAVLALRGRWGRPAPPPDPFAGMSAQAAGDSADRLVRSGRHIEALPLLEHIERLAIQTSADYEGGFATAYSNATVQVQEKNGLAIPATRSSVERIALLRESLRRLDQGEHKATNPEQARNLVVARAGLLALWGFVREGYAEYQRAHALSPLTPRGVSEAGWLEKMFIDPTVVLPPPVGPAPVDAPRGP